jgi:transcriptional regulator with XRE-family HTH domain
MGVDGHEWANVENQRSEKADRGAIRMSLGQIIRNKREELRLTLDEVSRKVGFSKPYLSTIETGKVKNPPGDELLARLEQVLQFESGLLLHLAHVERMPSDIRDAYEAREAENQKLRQYVKKHMGEANGKSVVDLEKEAEDGLAQRRSDFTESGAMGNADASVSFESFREQWLVEVTKGSPSTLELGRRFARKMVTQWRDVDEHSDDITYCDGSGDGGIDVAYLDRGDAGEKEEPASQGHTWYLVQSKYGKAFQGVNTLLLEGHKVIETLDGRRERLSSLAEGLLEMLRTFRANASERDHIVLVFATELPLREEERRILDDLRTVGRRHLGAIFDVESISIETIYQRTLENLVGARVRVALKADLVASAEELLIGSTPLIDLYEFLKSYRTATEDLDRLYEKNVRKFLGVRGKVNKAIQKTLSEVPDRFGLYNNGITIVVEDFSRGNDGGFELVEPFVVNGCQTTRTIWEVFHGRFEAGGNAPSEEFKEWRQKATRGVVVTKVVKVGIEGEQLLEQITRHTNTQNAIREKDFLALTSDFRAWAHAMEDRYGIYLEIQRGGWDSRRALQRQKPNIRQFSESANAFDLLKVYGSGWMAEAGVAFGKNAPFLPNGSIFRKVMNHEDQETEPFGVEDLCAAYRLEKAADELDFGRGSEKQSRRQTRFLFYMVVVDLLKDVLSRKSFPSNAKDVSRAMLRLFAEGQDEAADALINTAVDAIDTYLTPNTDNCIFDEPAFKGTFNHDLNGFLKWEKLGKTEADCPRFRNLLAVTKMVMGQRTGGQSSTRERIGAVLASQEELPNR